jgi:hypothetical protein
MDGPNRGGLTNGLHGIAGATQIAGTAILGGPVSGIGSDAACAYLIM